MELSQKMEEILRITKTTPQQLCEKTGVSKSLISQYRSGTAKPSYKQARPIASLAGVSVDWILSNEWVSLDEDLREQKLLKDYRKLNESGKIKIDENINDLIQLDKYIYKNNYVLKDEKKPNFG